MERMGQRRRQQRLLLLRIEPTPTTVTTVTRNEFTITTAVATCSSTTNATVRTATTGATPYSQQQQQQQQKRRRNDSSVNKSNRGADYSSRKSRWWWLWHNISTVVVLSILIPVVVISIPLTVVVVVVVDAFQPTTTTTTTTILFPRPRHQQRPSQSNHHHHHNYRFHNRLLFLQTPQTAMIMTTRLYSSSNDNAMSTTSSSVTTTGSSTVTKKKEEEKEEPVEPRPKTTSGKRNNNEADENVDESGEDMTAIATAISVKKSSSSSSSSQHQQLLKIPYETQYMDAKRQLEQIVSPLYQQSIQSYPNTKQQLQQLLHEYEVEQSDTYFWYDSNQPRIQLVQAQVSILSRLLQRLQQWEVYFGDATAALEMILELNDNSNGSNDNTMSTNTEERTLLLNELVTATTLLHDELQNAALEYLLSGPYDDCPARIVITAGAGGVEALDWVADLTRMYTRYCEKQFGYNSVTKVDWNDSGGSNSQGYKSMELLVTGPKAYGYLHGEKGSHRLVRISPYNAMNKRQTTFAGVDVTPELPPSIVSTMNDIVISDTDLEITTMRSSGKGGQNVNKVSSGVRMKHIPSGIVVRCTEERSQLMNKNIALHRLKTQLLIIAQEQRVQTITEIRGDIVEASWGTQIRSYVLHPYRQVKDTRTGWETTQAQDFLDGNDSLLHDCIGTYLRYKANQERQEAIDTELQR